MRRTAILLLFLMTAACAAGCSAPPPEEVPAPTAAATPAPPGGEEPEIAVTVVSLTPRYSPDRPFTFTARIRAENQGAIEARGVVITLTLIDEEANRITDTKNQYIERFMPGETKIFDITLSNADPARPYRVETGVIFNRP